MSSSSVVTRVWRSFASTQANSAWCHGSCLATVGAVSNPDHGNINRRQGRSFKVWRGKRPHVRGVVMNPVDHPHGGGEGRTSGGRHPVSRRGASPPRARSTRSNKSTDKFIMRSRHQRKKLRRGSLQVARSVWKGPFVDGYLLKKAEKVREGGRNEVIKMWSRRSTILPQFVGLTFGVYNGQQARTGFRERKTWSVTNSVNSLRPGPITVTVRTRRQRGSNRWARQKLRTPA